MQVNGEAQKLTSHHAETPYAGLIKIGRGAAGGGECTSLLRPGEPYTPNSEKDTSCLGPVEPYAPPMSKYDHIGKKEESHRDGPPPSPARALLLDICAVMGIAIMPKGHNTCIWLRLSSTELCGKSCLGDYCKVHLLQLRKGSRTKPCQGCGVGVVNKLRLCCPCGYRGEWRRAIKVTQREHSIVRLSFIQNEDSLT